MKTSRRELSDEKISNAVEKQGLNVSTKQNKKSYSLERFMNMFVIHGLKKA